MQQYILRRLALLVPTLLGASVVVFILVRLVPGDPAEAMLGGFATQDRIEALRREMGLDRPLFLQYGIWLRQVVTGDLGHSITSGRPVLQDILERFPATLELTILSTFLAIAIGTTLGILSATRHRSFLDLGTSMVSVAGMSLPVFWLALMLLYLFGVVLRWLPLSGRIELAFELKPLTGLFILDSVISGNVQALGDILKHLVLPAFCLAVIPLAVIARVAKASMLEVLRQDYIPAARAKGASERAVVLRHALRNALIPVITVVGARFGSQLAGAVLIEVVFAWPGFGRLVYDAIQFRDYPVVQGCILFISLVFSLVNLATDVLYAYVDPRIRFT